MLTKSDLPGITAKAERGDVDCQFQLAVHYLTDSVAGPQPQIAYGWARKASQAGHRDAKELLAKSGAWQTHGMGHVRKQTGVAPVLVALGGLGMIVLVLWALSSTNQYAQIAASRKPEAQDFATTPTRSNFMPISGATVQSVRLFESGFDAPEQNARVYSTQFISQTTRFIYWEIGLTFPAAAQSTTFVLRSSWYDAAGRLLQEEPSPAFNVDSGWTQSFHFHGFGNAGPGVYWKPGAYRVVISYGQNQLAQQAFTVVDENPTPEATLPGADIAQDPAIEQTLDRWAEAFALNDISSEVSFYAAEVDPYFRVHNVSRQFIESEKQKLFDRGVRLTSYHIRDLRITMNSPVEAVVLLTKDWQTQEGAENARSTRSRIHLRLFNQEWKIVGEQDLTSE